MWCVATCLVIPIGDSLLYVEPLYLQAQSGKIPELKRVVIATADRVVMAENLGLALVKLFGRETGHVPGCRIWRTVVSWQANLPAASQRTVR